MTTWKDRRIITDRNTACERKAVNGCGAGARQGSLARCRGNPLRAAGTHMDITERTNLEAEFHASEERYHQLFTTAQDGIILTNPDLTIHQANPAALKMLGLEEKTAGGIRLDQVIDSIDPDYQFFVEEIKRNKSLRGEITFIRADGTNSRRKSVPPSIVIGMVISGECHSA